MGVVNVTPDSFSDGGLFADADDAVRHGLDLAAAGAAVIDVGGESTRPGAAPVPEDVELDRVIPVVSRLAAATDVPISIDTTKSAVADAALRAGAVLVNDVSGATRDPDTLGVVADHDAGLVVMHSRGVPATMQAEPHYDDVVAEVAVELSAMISAARRAGVRDDAIMADPGIGFAKSADHNLALLAALTELARRVAVPFVVGASRKSFLAAILDGAAPDQRDDATLATTVWAFTKGMRMVRVHDVESSVRAGRLLDLLDRATPDGIEPRAAA